MARLASVSAVSVPELRPLGVGELLDVALKIWRRHFWTLARIVIVVVAPVEIVGSFVLTVLTPQETVVVETEFGPRETFADGADAGAFVAGALLAGILSGVAFLISSAAALRAVSVAYLGGEPDWRESLRLAGHRLGSLVWLATIAMFGLGIGFLFFVLPGIWLAVSWSVAFAVLVAEGRGGTGALRRSFQLVRGRWWPTFGTLFLAFVLQVIVEQIVAIPILVGPLSDDSGGFGQFLGLSLTSIVSAALTTPFIAAVFVLLYFDLRVRKEGFDLELLAQAIEVPPGGPPHDGGWAPPAAPPPPPASPPLEPKPSPPLDPEPPREWPPPDR